MKCWICLFVVSLAAQSLSFCVRANTVAAPHAPAYTLVGNASQVRVPFDYAGNIHIPVRVDGHPLQFIFDSANVDSLARGAADRVGIAVQGAAMAEGGGPKPVKVGFAGIKTLSIDGKVMLHDQTLLVVPLPRGLSTRYPLDGTIGYGVLQHFVVRVDYQDHSLTFMRPGTFDPVDAGQALPLTFYKHRLPVVAGSIDGLQGHFFVDTGASPFSLILSSAFVRAHRLDARYRATPAMVSGVSTGGDISTRTARGGAFRMGGLTVANPVVTLSTSKAGFAASKTVDGDIGGRILSRFTVTFDYPQGKIYLKPDTNYGRPMNNDRSGMSLLATGNAHAGVSILGVMPHGPAARAGLRPGDVITAVNGVPASEIGNIKFAAMLRNDAPGTRIKLTVRDDHKLTSRTLVLRRLIPAIGMLN